MTTNRLHDANPESPELHKILKIHKSYDPNILKIHKVTKSKNPNITQSKDLNPEQPKIQKSQNSEIPKFEDSKFSNQKIGQNF